jgi:hypothetical protein
MKNIFNSSKVFRISHFFKIVVLVLLMKGKPADILVTPNVVKVSQSVGTNWLTIVHTLITVSWCAIHKKCPIYLTDIHFYANSNVEQLGEVLSTGGQIHPRAVDKEWPTVQEVTSFSYYAIRLRPKNVHWSEIRWARDWNIGDEGTLIWAVRYSLKKNRWEVLLA